MTVDDDRKSKPLSSIVREGAVTCCCWHEPDGPQVWASIWRHYIVVADLKARAKKVSTNDEIAQVGTISANGDAEIGAMLAKAMQKVGNEGVITVEEAKTAATELDVVEGMQFDLRPFVSPTSSPMPRR